MVDVELMLWPCGEPRLPMDTVADVGSAGQLSVRGLMALEYTIVYALTGSFPPIYCFLRLFGCLVLSPGTFNNTELFSLFFLRQSWFRAPYRLVRLFYLFLYITKISLFVYCKFWVNTAIFSIEFHKLIPRHVHQGLFSTTRQPATSIPNVFGCRENILCGTILWNVRIFRIQTCMIQGRQS